MARRWNRLLRGIPFPIKLPWGHWWLVRNDGCGNAILRGEFEQSEVGFVASYLRPGMTMLDIGAHHGFYTLLGAKRVGHTGRVIAFEPSPRERRLLTWHVRLNRCLNVDVEQFALGSREDVATLFVADDLNSGCNSLRRPGEDVKGRITEINVRTRRLDEVLQEKLVRHVDFIKLDAEGGELEILKGADELLAKAPRPLMLIEVQDVRTRPWGYEAAEIIAFLGEHGYEWFQPSQDGQLKTLEQSIGWFEGNFVAIPRENLDEVANRYGI